MNSARELAEKIHKAIIVSLANTPQAESKDIFFPWSKIESLLGEAMEEVIMFERSEGGMTINWKHGYDKGQNDAREKAKGIAENFDCSSRPPRPCCGAESEIADRIGRMEMGK